MSDINSIRRCWSVVTLSFFLLLQSPVIFASESKSTAPRYMVAAADPRAVDAGLQMLERGGSAVDAAIAVQLVLNLVEPQSSGIGGGGFMLHYDAAAQTVISYDGRETAPVGVTEELFLAENGKPMNFFDAVVGGRAVGTPGLTAMMALAHREHGLLPWRTLFQPAIELATQGFSVGNRLAQMIAGPMGQNLARFSETRAYFLPNGTPLKAGDIRKNPAFARTLNTIAEKGADAFYRGEIAENIVAAVRNAPQRQGFLSQSDLESYASLKRAAICHVYRDYRICGMGPPSSGALTVGQILGILENFDLAKLDEQNPISWHLFAEASKLAYADRNRYIADSDFVSVPVEAMLTAEYLAQRAELISENASIPVPAKYGLGCQQSSANCTAESIPDRAGTSHISIVDARGNAVSMTTTIEGPFGAYLMVDGFLLNNQLTDFSFRPRLDRQPVANRVQPGKRPRSSTSPTLVFNEDGSLRLVIGSPGGSRIIGYVAKTLIAVLDWGLDVQAAIDLPNISNRNGPTEIEPRSGAQQVVSELNRLGHEIKQSSLTSGLHGIEIVDGVLRGGADPRREGIALGR